MEKSKLDRELAVPTTLSAQACASQHFITHFHKDRRYLLVKLEDDTGTEKRKNILDDR